MKKWGIMFCSLLLLFALTACGKDQASSESKDKKSSEPLKVTLPTWTGYGPLFLAKEKGFFKKNGIDVELSIVEGLGERKQALASGKIDGMATALDVQVSLAASKIPVQVVWLLDDSYGGDGILVKNGINDVKDLKGKKMAFEVGSTSHMLALTALKQGGLSEKDVEVVPMSAGDAGAAFAAGKVDAAVTWEPWLSKGSEANGKVLLTTKDLPGIIVDTISFKEDVIKNRPEDVKAFVKAMGEAMNYWKENKDDADKIMAKGLKIDEKEFVATETGLKFLTDVDNKKLFGSESNKGSIYQSAENAIKFYKEQNIIKEEPKVEDVINPSFQ
ncbi:ABC transporter, substrate-binding protein, aliphatic sulfonates [Neobacillus bataviensis LMG 21833]|uniref:ABC transporter, substrate-binding protein, aliphatic sulfonates n=1 Tax=Neobacillus bataviensis LMG 21833 TaxID=1117379 RepID=K6DDG0_9BACI|nr:ABC transporter substrate-binding protein [Neobacillus bataviensis]EKN70547.1 ABC transporter, substrate-binding protein, aliphatic sulfonates [Neobacillus bataviensis LMG 21833]